MSNWYFLEWVTKWRGIKWRAIKLIDDAGITVYYWPAEYLLAGRSKSTFCFQLTFPLVRRLFFVYQVLGTSTKHNTKDKNLQSSDAPCMPIWFICNLIHAYSCTQREMFMKTSRPTFLVMHYLKCLLIQKRSPVYSIKSLSMEHRKRGTTELISFLYPFLDTHCCHLQISNSAFTWDQVLGLTLRPLESAPSDSWAHTLRLFSPLLHSSSQPAIIFRSSDCSDGQVSLRYWNPFERITAACADNSTQKTNTKW